MLPATYINTSAHNVTPLCPVRERLGVGLQLESGEVLRLALTEQSAVFLLKALADYVKSPAGCQSPMSDEIPSAPKSVPSDGENV